MEIFFFFVDVNALQIQTKIKTDELLFSPLSYDLIRLKVFSRNYNRLMLEECVS